MAYLLTTVGEDRLCDTALSVVYICILLYNILIMEIPDPGVECPIEVLQNFIAADETQTVLAVLRRQSGDDGVFGESALQEVSDDAHARIYIMNIGGAVRAYGANRDLLKSRFAEARNRGNSLIDATVSPIAQALEANHQQGRPLYALTYTVDEMNELAERVVADHSEAEKIIADFGAPKDVKLDPRGSLVRYAETWEEVKKCDGRFQVDYPLVYNEELILFGADMTHSGHFNTIIVGVNEYGSDITRRLMLAHKKVSESVGASRADFALWEDTDIGDTRKLSRILSKNKVPEEQLISQLTMYEGSLTILQTLSMMLTDKVEGYANGDDLVREIIVSGLISRFARKVPYAGIVGPLSTAGLSFKNLLVNQDGELVINPELEKAFAESRRRMREQVTASYGSLDGYDNNHRFMSFNGCPVAHDYEGVINRLQKISDLYLEAFASTN